MKLFSTMKLKTPLQHFDKLRNGQQSQQSSTNASINTNIVLRTTDLMKEIIQIQSLNPSLILFVQVGGFYEIYDHNSYLIDIA